MRNSRTWRWTTRVVHTYVIVLVLGPFLWSGVTGRSCAAWAQREVDALDVPATDLAVVAGTTRHVSVPVLPAGWTGLAVPGTTFVAPDASPDVMIHEAAHQIQMRDDGLVRYAARYGSDWVRGLYNGCGPFDAYRSVRYEIQARDAQYRVPDDAWGIADTSHGPIEFVDALDSAGADTIVAAAAADRRRGREAAWFAVLARDAFLEMRSLRDDVQDAKRHAGASVGQ